MVTNKLNAYPFELVYTACTPPPFGISASQTMFSPRKRRHAYLKGWRKARRVIAAAARPTEEHVSSDEEVEYEEYEGSYGGDHSMENEDAEGQLLGDEPGSRPPANVTGIVSEHDTANEVHGSEVSEEEVISTSEDEGDRTEAEEKTAKKVLVEWALKHGVSHNALDDLLRAVRTVNPLESWRRLPLSARTLLQTNRHVDTEFVGPMERVKDQDVKATLQRNFMKYPIAVRNATASLPITLSTDGMPFYNSANKTLWPLMCAIQLEPMCVFPLSLNVGPPKPPSADFLIDPLRVMNRLLHDGLEVDGRILPLELRCIIADAPARSLIKGTVQFNSTSGCDKCALRTQWTYTRDSDNEAAAVERVLMDEAERRGQPTRNINRKKKRGGRSTFLQTADLPLRTDAAFRMQADPQHHKCASPFLMLPVDMVAQFPIDYMHQVCLGVMKKLLQKWFQEPIRQRTLSANAGQRADGRLVSLRSFMPREFARKPRSISELKHWKATEYRQFLLYTGRIVLEGILPPANYDNFLALSVACLILVSPTLTRKYLALARDLLKYFVETVRATYGAKWLHYNIHSMLHLADEAERYGSLDACSAFPFENELYQMKKMVRAGKYPLRQLHNRLAELEVGPGELISRKDRLLSTKEPNNSYVLPDKRCVALQSIEEDEAICHDYGVGRPAFDRPINSRRLGILVATEVPIELTRVDKALLTQKAMRFPTPNGMLFQVMQHNTAF